MAKLYIDIYIKYILNIKTYFFNFIKIPNDLRGFMFKILKGIIEGLSNILFGNLKNIKKNKDIIEVIKTHNNLFENLPQKIKNMEVFKELKPIVDIYIKKFKETQLIVIDEKSTIGDFFSKNFEKYLENAENENPNIVGGLNIINSNDFLKNILELIVNDKNIRLNKLFISNILNLNFNEILSSRQIFLSEKIRRMSKS
jgi:hypothetical protein